MAMPPGPAEPAVIVLASASAARAGMLRNAGISFIADPAPLDEAPIKRACAAAGQSVEATVLCLAHAKAQAVAIRHPGAVVIGADQMLECGSRRFDKPCSRGAARAQLLALRGRGHRLVSGACLFRGGTVLWQGTDEASLEMRHFTEAWLDDYLRAMNGKVLRTVGAYEIEGLGLQLFSRVSGDHFTIRGLPLLALLGALRSHGLLPE